MLPGGLLVLGVFTVAAPELAKEIQNTLRKVKGNTPSIPLDWGGKSVTLQILLHFNSHLPQPADCGPATSERTLVHHSCPRKYYLNSS